MISRIAAPRTVLIWTVVLLSLLLCDGRAAGQTTVIQVDDLDFMTAGQNMWGPGTSFQMDETFDQLLFPFNDSGTVDATILGTGVSFDYSVMGKAGLEARLRIDSGTVNTDYPIRLSAMLPDKVGIGDTFTIDTSSFSHLPSLLSTTGPAARFTLDAILELDASVGPGSIKAVGFDVAEFGTTSLDFPDYRKSLIDIGSGASGIEFDTGPWGTISLDIPEQLNTSTTDLHDPELKFLESAGVNEDKFLNMSVDIDAIAQSAFGLPEDVLEGDFELLDDDNGDGNADLSFEYTLLNLQADLGLKFAQQFRFTPDSIDIKMTSSTGEVETGQLGEGFTFTAPSATGEVTIDAEFTMNGRLRNQTGFVANGSLTLEVLELVLHNEIGPDFDANLAKDLLGLDRDFLIEEEIPEGGLQSDPLYVFDETFKLGGFMAQDARYSVDVIGKDFGDAPDSYRTLLASNGPRYLEGDLQRLGEIWDWEKDGQPTLLANGDDASISGGYPNPVDDEDGILFGGNYVDVFFNITRPGVNDYLFDAWWDTNRNGVFDHPGPIVAPEHYIDEVISLAPGLHSFRFALPFDPRKYYSRHRLTWADGPGGVTVDTDITPFGEFRGADGFSHGEVEDYPAVPEPSTFVLLSIGGVALVGCGWRRKRRQECARSLSLCRRLFHEKM